MSLKTIVFYKGTENEFAEMTRHARNYDCYYTYTTEKMDEDVLRITVTYARNTETYIGLILSDQYLQYDIYGETQPDYRPLFQRIHRMEDA